MGSGRGWPADDGGILNITAAAWTAGFQWWHSGNITRRQNVSEYMLVLAVYACTRCMPSILLQHLFYFIAAVCTSARKLRDRSTHAGHMLISLHEHSYRFGYGTV